jgi:tetratricopeptide (TPR) repeat protein
MDFSGSAKQLFWCVRAFLLSLAIFVHPFFGQQNLAPQNNDPLGLQKEGIAKIDHWTDYVRRTGDSSTTVSEFALAQSDLKASYDLLLKGGDFAGASWSAIKVGDVQRLKNQFREAATIYSDAAELAKRANRVDYQAKALAEIAFCELRLGDITSAEDHSREAVTLGLDCGNKNFYFDALDVASQVEVKRRNLGSAAEYIGRALAMSDQIEKKRLYLGYSDRAEIHYQLALKCDYLRTFDTCYQSVDLSRADYQKALAITQDLGFDFLSQMFRDLLKGLDSAVVLRANQIAIDSQIIQSQGNSERAEALLREALAIQERSATQDSRELVRTMGALAELLLGRDKTEEAEILYQRVLSINEKASGRRSLEVAETLTSLSRVYLKQAKYTEAEQQLVEAVNTERNLQGTDRGSLATALSNLGSVYRAEEKYDRATVCYQEALQLREKLLGTDSPVTANSYNDLGALYYYLGEYEKSQHDYQFALKALRLTLGPNHTEVATTLNNLGLAYQAAGRYRVARPYLAEALGIRLAALGHNHPDTAATLNNLATLDVVEGNYDEAKQLFENALAIDSNALGPDHPTTKMIAANLADIRKKRKGRLWR